MTMDRAMKRALRVLVVGGAGAIGISVCRALMARGHSVRCLDRKASADVVDSVVGDMNDPAILDSATDGMDVIILLAARPNDGDFMTQLLPNNIVGPYRLFEIACKKRIQRLIVTSSTQVQSGLTRVSREKPLSASDGTLPTNHYGVTKVFVEELAKMYAIRHNMSTIAVRVGWLPRNSREVGKLEEYGSGNIYLSPVDAGRFYLCAVESEQPEPGQYAIVNATSRPVTATVVELDSARTIIGYVPTQTWPQGIDAVPEVDASL